MNQRVFGVIAASRSSARSLKPLFCGHGTNTGVPSDTVTMSGYDTQHGLGMITSSPAFRVASMALNSTCLAPVEMMISSGL